MNNISNEVDWISREIKRFKDIGILIPNGQRKLYEAVSKHFSVGRSVIDIGSSCGVGTNILSYWSRFVWGIDVNKEAVNFSKQMHKRPNMDFELFDIENPPSREVAKFEILVMSEVIEHLSNPQKALDNVKRLFTKDGIGFITFPNINNEEVKRRDAVNKLHNHHWTAGEFYAFMIENFNIVTMYSVDKLYDWSIEETVDGNTKDGLIVCKVELPK